MTTNRPKPVDSLYCDVYKTDITSYRWSFSSSMNKSSMDKSSTDGFRPMMHQTNMFRGIFYFIIVIFTIENYFVMDSIPNLID